MLTSVLYTNIFMLIVQMNFVRHLHEFKPITRLASRSHIFNVEQDSYNRKSYYNSFFSETSCWKNSLPVSYFPVTYNLNAISIAIFSLPQAVLSLSFLPSKVFSFCFSLTEIPCILVALSPNWGGRMIKIKNLR